MQSSKVYHFLLLLTPQEQKHFYDFLQSPFFNKKQEMVDLYLIFREMIQQPNKGNVTEVDAFSQLVPDAPFNKNRLRKWKSELQDLLLTFLKVKSFQKNEMASKLALLDELNERQELEYFPQYLKEARKKLEQKTLPDSGYFRDGLALEMSNIRYLLRKGQRIFREGPDQSTTKSLRYLESAYQEEKLELLYVIGIQRGFYGDNDQLEQWKAFLLPFADKLPQLSAKGKIFYRLCTSLLEPTNKELFRALLQELELAKPHLPKAELLDLYTATLNLCIIRMNNGFPNWDRELFHLYHQMLKSEILLTKGKIYAFHFKNIVATAARVEEYEWLHHFIDAFSKRLTADPNKNAVTYNLGVLRFFEGNTALKAGDKLTSHAKFDEAEKLFNRVLPDFKDVFYGMDARVFLLRIYYETGNTIGMDSLCSSLRMFIIRNKAISRKRKSSYQTFLRFYRRLMNTKPMDFKRLNKLREEVVAAGNIGGPWLKEKLDELIPN